MEDQERTRTDFKFLKFFGIYLIVWIVVSAYGKYFLYTSTILTNKIIYVYILAFQTGNGSIIKDLKREAENEGAQLSQSDKNDLIEHIASAKYEKKNIFHLIYLFLNKHFNIFRYLILVSIALAAVFSVVYIILLRWYAKLIVWTFIVLFCLMLLVFICHALNLYLKDPTNNERFLTAIIVSCIIFIATVICVLVGRKKIAIACEVIREATR